ncbi:branched-chain amino acid transport system II carrier protein [Sungkyunkwania multivorans]|uniref:Branched-chain amino acid transport system II carrier protein n=1 Tax=Sungkyunkwania multivorans TaxID=1173618 RepID=A0ABW3CZZ4_9FLAO
MNKTNETFVTGFALFAMFFGAGNLLLPPMLGYNAGSDWPLIVFGFAITAVVIPLFGILAHARLQGTMYDFAKKVSPIFSTVYCVLVYLISAGIPSPRTAAATHEIAVAPNFQISSLVTSSVYFMLVFIFVMNRSKILSFIGKYLTPIIVVILLMVIGIGLFSAEGSLQTGLAASPIATGLLEGYQTFDAIGAVVIGGVVIISLNLKGHKSFEAKKYLISRAGFIAGLGLMIMYAGLVAVGAFFRSEVAISETLSSDLQRAQLLNYISGSALGNIGSAFLNVLISLACFTTAVGIVTGTSDYFKGLFKDSQRVYVITAILACVAGVVVGQLDFYSILIIAIPALFLVYPVTIVLIFLNVLPQKWASVLVFRAVVIVAILFSIPDVLGFFWSEDLTIKAIKEVIPLANQHFGWVIPSILVFIFSNMLSLTISNR